MFLMNFFHNQQSLLTANINKCKKNSANHLLTAKLTILWQAATAIVAHAPPMANCRSLKLSMTSSTLS